MTKWIPALAWGLLAALSAPALSSPASAQGTAQQPPAQLTPDQKGYIVYHQCMLYAAIRASRTDARDEDIFALAKQDCATTRTRVTAGLEGNREYMAALDAADAEKQANFPAWIKDVREKRRLRDAGAQPRAPAP